MIDSMTCFEFLLTHAQNKTKKMPRSIRADKPEKDVGFRNIKKKNWTCRQVFSFAMIH